MNLYVLPQMTFMEGAMWLLEHHFHWLISYQS